MAQIAPFQVPLDEEVVVSVGVEVGKPGVVAPAHIALVLHPVAVLGDGQAGVVAEVAVMPVQGVDPIVLPQAGGQRAGDLRQQLFYLFLRGISQVQNKVRR